MNLRDLKYLLALADHQHFGRAAAACFVSQPTLSTQIKKLEDELGVSLVERAPRNVMLTPAGTRRRRTRAPHRRRSGADEGRRTPQPGPGSRHRAAGHLPDAGAVPAAARGPAHPRTFPASGAAAGRGEDRRAAVAPARRQARRGPARAAGARRPAAQRVPVRGTFLLAVPENHPLAKRDSLEPQRLSDQQLLLLEDGHCLRDQALDVCRLSGANENRNSAPPAWKRCGRWSPPASASPCCPRWRSSHR